MALSIRDIRWESVALFLFFPLAACTFDLMYAARDFQWLGMDSIALQRMAFHLSWLCAFFFRKPPMRIVGVCAWSALSLIGLMYFGPLSLEIVFCLAFHVAIGFCMAAALYGMMFWLNNAERLFGLLLRSAHYGLSLLLRHLLQGAGAYALDYDMVYANAGLFALALAVLLLRMGKGEWLEPKTGGIESIETGKTRLGHYAVFALVALFDFFTSTLSGLTYITLMSSLAACAAGVAVGVAVIWILHARLRRGIWHGWNLFLAATTLGILCGFVRTYTAHALAQGLLSAGESVGLIATSYMVFAVGKKTRDIRFYRGYCGLSVLLSMLSILFLKLDLDVFSQNYLQLSLAIMAVCLLITALLAPVMQEYLFTPAWSDAFHQRDTGLEMGATEQAGQSWYPALTPREREVCALLLRGKTMRQIGAELSISQSTVSFHCHRVYQKFGVSSRTELFAKAGYHVTLPS